MFTPSGIGTTLVLWFYSAVKIFGLLNIMLMQTCIRLNNLLLILMQ